MNFWILLIIFMILSSAVMTIIFTFIGEKKPFVPAFVETGVMSIILGLAWLIAKNFLH